MPRSFPKPSLTTVDVERPCRHILQPYMLSVRACHGRFWKKRAKGAERIHLLIAHSAAQFVLLVECPLTEKVRPCSEKILKDHPSSRGKAIPLA